jgi:hypothetical protein
MREIYYNSDITPKVANEIKLLALYYDKINIVDDLVISGKLEKIDSKFQNVGSQDFPFIPKSFKLDYKLLIDEGLISIDNEWGSGRNDYKDALQQKASEMIYYSYDIIFPKHPQTNIPEVTEEVYNIIKHIVDFEWGQSIPEDFLFWYYSVKLRWLVQLLIEGKNCIGSNDNLNYLFTSFIRNADKAIIEAGMTGFSRSLAVDALKIGLPNPDVLTIEDILELKVKLKDELGLFYQTVNEIEVKHKLLFDGNIKQKEYQAIFFSEIQRPLLELETKMKNLKSKTFRQFVDKMKDYKTYVPMVGTVVASLPMQYAVLASLGMTVGPS